jgi:MFS superfamily sulfate permease-like transporter
VLHIGFVTKYLSDVIVSGFTIGAGKKNKITISNSLSFLIDTFNFTIAYHIVVSQINVLLGIKLGATNLPFAIIAV